LKHKGYRRVVLAGQSFGAFISLSAAGRSDAVDVAIGTAPAAYGSARSNPTGYTLNATRLYDLLGNVRRELFFEGDVFDPGGRGPIADQISRCTAWHISSSIGPPGSRPIGPVPGRHSPRDLRPAS
jgi:hypothetical protein